MSSSTKPQPYQAFGELLKQGIELLRLSRNQSKGHTLTYLAHQVDFSTTSFYVWQRGEHLPPPEVIVELARLFIDQWGADPTWIEDFLTKGQCGPTNVLLDELFGDRTGQIEVSPPIPRQNYSARCPYPGLSPFREQNAPFFFGRKAFTDQLVEIVQNRPAIALVGSSGSGKSSVVCAGLIPILRQTENWLIIPFRPGADPLSGLAVALVNHLEPDITPVDRLFKSHQMAEAFRKGDLKLLTVIQQLRHQYPRLLMVIDQFEEIYTLCPEIDLRHRFIDILLAATGHGATLLLAVRADFMGKALDYRPLADTIQQSTLFLGPMTNQELIQAITAPAKKQRLTFADGLVTRLLDDVGYSSGNLPLLQFALAELWKHQTNGHLSHSAYETIGRVEGALTHYANRFYDNLSQAEQKQLRYLLTQLVQPGKGTEDTRRILLRGELSRVVDETLLQRLIEARLIVTDSNPTGQETLELIHEALIQHWDQLQQWMEEERDFRLWQERFRSRLHQWQTTHDKAELLSGPSLAEAQTWRKQKSEILNRLEQTFIEASLKHHRKKRRQNILITAVLGIMTVIAVGMGINAYYQQKLAAANADRTETIRREKRVTLAHSLAAQALQIRSNDPELAALLAVKAFQINRAEKGNGYGFIDNSLRTIMSEPYFNIILDGSETRIWTVAFSPDGKLLAMADANGSIRLWNTARLDNPPHLLETGYRISALVFSLNSNELITGEADGTIRLWKIEALSSQILGRHQAPIFAVAISPDGHRLASADGTGLIYVRAMTRPHAVLAELNHNHNRVWAIAFSPDSQTMASAGSDGIIRLWNLNAPDSPPVLLANGHQGQIFSLDFSPNGATLAAASHDATIQLWDMTDLSAPPRLLTGHEGPIRVVAFSPDGEQLASAGLDQTIRLWSMTNVHRPPAILTGHETPIWAVAFSPDGERLASAADMTIRLWQVDRSPARPLVLKHSETAVNTVSFTSNGKLLASGGDDGVVRLWDLHKPAKPTTELVGQEVPIQAVTFSPDDQWLASAGADGNIWLWPISSPKNTPLIISDQKGTIRSIAFHPTDPVLASGGDDGTVQLWQLNGSIQRGQLFEAHQTAISAIAFSPDGFQLAAAGEDGSILLWHLTAPERPPVILNGTASTFYSLAFGPAEAGSHRLAAAGNDWAIHLWHLAASLEYTRLPFEATLGLIQAVAFSSDGQYLATAYGDKTVRLWSIQNLSAPPAILVGHKAEVTAVQFSPNLSSDPGGQLLASGSLDGTIRLWPTTEGLVDMACHHVHRRLSSVEWNRYLTNETHQQVCY